MKFLFLVLLLPFTSLAQFGSIKVAFMGNSFCNGCCVPIVGDERPDAYRYKVRQHLERFYSTVTQIKLCSGGEDITDAMPDWYPGAITARNIDTALRSQPDLIIIEYSGNHFADLVPYDTILACYQYIADTLASLGQRYVFTSSTPRKVTFDAPLTYVEYQDTAQQFNSWLYSNYPDNSVNIFTSLYDPSINKPYFDYLGSDSLHWNATGYEFIYLDILTSTIIDTLTAYEKPRLYNVAMALDGDSVDITAATIRAKNITISGSDDGTTFTELYSQDFEYTEAIRVEAYNFIKLVATNNDKIVTFTRNLTP